MLATGTCRTLIGDWIAPGKTEQEEEAPQTVIDPTPQQAPVKTVRDGETTISGGIAYQRCGGGRRVIRKRIGGN